MIEKELIHSLTQNAISKPKLLVKYRVEIGSGATKYISSLKTETVKKSKLPLFSLLLKKVV